MPWIFNYSHLSAQEVTKLLGNAPLCALPATLESHRVVFKGHSRKWGGALATLEKKRKAVVYGSAFLVYPEEFSSFRKEFPKFEDAPVKVTLTTGDMVKATAFVMAEGKEEGEPSKDYAKAMTKHLRFFWDSGEGQKLKLADFLYTAPPPPPATAEKPKAEKTEKPEKEETSEEESEAPKKRGRPRGAKNKKGVTKE